MGLGDCHRHVTRESNAATGPPWTLWYSPGKKFQAIMTRADFRV